ncbi:hypothetical protein [Actinophytocola sp.]|uniref:hypothetical protein n=1 Tax=Actinophytocola sp. TaxID=1872138 RepID=UPI002D3B5B60|nr:hypothetical protein [Actinophytocola sp.]HYQ63558.1 hypothetical protein [Actinophytocola sp.]
MLTRVLRTAAAAIDHTFVVGETPTDSSTTPVAVTITDANGDSVQTGNATSAGAGTGRYTFALTPRASLDLLTVEWSATIAGAAVVEVDEVEIVGGRLFTLAQARASDPILANTSKYTTADLAAALLETEQELEEITDRSFFGRYRREVLDGTGTGEVLLPGHDLRTIRAVQLAPRVDGTFVPLSAGALAALALTPDNTLVRTDGAVWTEGRRNVIVEYELGLSRPPADLVRAAKTRFRTWCNVTRSGVPDRALSFTTAEGTNYRLDQPGAYKTGIPEVDGVYGRYSLRDGAGAGDGRSVPASRPLNFDPQYNSLFHGGVR